MPNAIIYLPDKLYFKLKNQKEKQSVIVQKALKLYFRMEAKK